MIHLKKKQITIDTYLCNGCGACAAMSSEVFRLNEINEKAELVTLEPEITDAVLQAIACCPEKCIEIE